jgi:DNA-binding transcriptional ArsR family regulator
MTWLRAAASLQGKALHVGVEIWFQVGLKRSSEVALSLSQFETSGISRSAASRGLTKLEEAGLVSVLRAPGRKPVVTVLLGSEPNSQTLG